MNSLQLDLFLEDDDLMLVEIQKTKKDLHKVRKGMFAQMGELQALYIELKIDIERIENQLLKVKE